MSTEPFFSVIIPVYNGAATLNRALDSLAAQTFSNFETIVVDDGSADGTYEIAKSHALFNTTVLRNAQNMERCHSRNKGIAIAKGTYICFLDADDYHLPNHLEVIFRQIQDSKNPADLIFVQAWDESNEGIRSPRNCPPFVGEKAMSYFLRFTVNPQRWAVKKKLLLNHPFDPSIPICEDMDVSLRLAAAGCHIVQIPIRTTVYVANPSGFTHGDPNKWEREWGCLQRIFSRPELKKLLSGLEKRRLESMCRFHFAQKAFKQNERAKTIRQCIWSFALCPKGYNGKTNKILLVMLMYSVPFLGPMLQRLMAKMKRSDR
jgi:glycosyltransferase involved in cell wall biosynthesis